MTQGERSGMKSINIKMLLDHNIRVSGHYYRPTESDILGGYMTHPVDALTIDITQKLQKKVEKLETEQAQEIARLRTEFKEWEPVKAEMIELWRTIQRLENKYKDKE